jgi:cystathionine gamma-synthase
MTREERIVADRDLRPETRVVSAGRPQAGPDAPLSTPVVFSSTYRAGGPVGYGRDGNPTWEAFEHAVGDLEGGAGTAFSSGMAAATTLLEGLPVGARVVAPTTAYMGVRTFLRECAASGRLSVELVDVTDTAATLAACAETAVLWLESPTNPLIGVADLAALIEGGHEAGALVVVDNTFATPLLQRPLELGADAVLHSVTKYLAGHADLLMGAVVTRDEGLREGLLHRRHLYGGVPGPMDAFLALRGLRTLAVRLERAQANAGVLAERLASHPAVALVRYPGLATDPGHALAARQMRGFGAMLSFEVHGGALAAERVCETVRVITYATSLGGVESLLERRARWPGDADMPPGLIRFSVGIEHVEDLWVDLERALGAAVD